MKKRFFLLSLVVMTFPLSAFAAPVRTDLSEIEDQIPARAYVVIDRATGTWLTVKNEHLVWPIASITKLMTAHVVLQKQVPLQKIQPVLTADDVGGAKLYVKNGDKFSVSDLFYAMIIGSANNAANALARSTGLAKAAFVKEMNTQARVLGLKSTTYVDPSGIELGNLSTPLEVARVADKVFGYDLVRSYSQLSDRTILDITSGERKNIKTTNWMLTQPTYKNGYVIAGKTGYLDESKWNFVTALRPDSQSSQKELLIVVFGVDSRADSFEAVKQLSNWAWSHYEWPS